MTDPRVEAACAAYRGVAGRVSRQAMVRALEAADEATSRTGTNAWVVWVCPDPECPTWWDGQGKGESCDDHHAHPLGDYPDLVPVQVVPADGLATDEMWRVLAFLDCHGVRLEQDRDRGSWGGLPVYHGGHNERALVERYAKEALA